MYHLVSDQICTLDMYTFNRYIHDEYRIIFKIDNNGSDVIDVEIVDYH